MALKVTLNKPWVQSLHYEWNIYEIEFSWFLLALEAVFPLLC